MLKDYVNKFNNNDEEFIVQTISNDMAYDFLKENTPVLTCPDKVIEETFAFRLWTIRKHLKTTNDGVMMTEFLPSVSWAGKHNTINAPFFHHLNEYRWFKNADILLDYVWHFIENKGGNAYVYSTPALTACYEFLSVTGNENLIYDNADKFEKYFLGWEEKHLLDNGLYWSFDNYDAMELSISGSNPSKNATEIYKKWIKTGDNSGVNSNAIKGIRPTLNAYMYGDAITLSKIFNGVGNVKKANYYREKADKIKRLVDDKLWDGNFYKAIHLNDINGNVSYKDIKPEMNCPELIAYNLWAYNLPSEDKAYMFNYLKDEAVFKGKTGFTTADKSHPRYLYAYPHECLWNGYVWPYATSQAINGVISLLNNYNQTVINNNDLYNFIKTYANMHYIEKDGKTINWIDEVMHPDKLEWTSRTILKNLGWLKNKGGYERGKDYNHSTFIDLVLRGLIGIDVNATTLTVNPRVKGIWKWFKIENLTFKKKTYTIYYDEDGCKFNKGVGVIIEKE